MKHLKIYVILVLSLTFFASTFVFATDVFAIDHCNAGFKVQFNDKKIIYCYSSSINSIVINENASNQDIFIPTKTSAEWNSFDNNRPVDTEVFYKGPITQPFGGISSMNNEAVFWNDQFCVLNSYYGHVGCFTNGTWTDEGLAEGKLISWDYNNDGDEDLCYQTESDTISPDGYSELNCMDNGSWHNDTYTIPHDDGASRPVSPQVDSPPDQDVFLTGTYTGYNDYFQVDKCNNQTGLCSDYFSVGSALLPDVYLKEAVYDGNILCAIAGDNEGVYDTRIYCHNPTGGWGGLPITVTIGDLPNNDWVYSDIGSGDNTAVMWNNKLYIGSGTGSVYCGEYDATSSQSGTGWVSDSWDLGSVSIASLVQWDGRLYAGTTDGEIYYYRPLTADWNEFFPNPYVDDAITLSVNENTEQMCSITRYSNEAFCLNK